MATEQPNKNRRKMKARQQKLAKIKSQLNETRENCRNFYRVKITTILSKTAVFFTEKGRQLMLKQLEIYLYKSPTLKQTKGTIASKKQRFRLKYNINLQQK